MLPYCQNFITELALHLAGEEMGTNNFAQYDDVTVSDWEIITAAYNIHTHNLPELCFCILCFLQHHLLAMWETYFLDEPCIYILVYIFKILISII